MICALFPHHADSDEKEVLEPKYATFCSTDIYNHLLLWVRTQTLRGHAAEDIQKRLDDKLGDILFGKEEVRGILE